MEQTRKHETPKSSLSSTIEDSYQLDGLFSEKDVAVQHALLMKQSVFFPEQSDTKPTFINERYKIGNYDQDIKFKENYENVLAVFYAVRLALDDNIENFKLSVNNTDYAFSDIVLEVKYKKIKRKKERKVKKAPKRRKRPSQMNDDGRNVTINLKNVKIHQQKQPRIKKSNNSTEETDLPNSNEKLKEVKQPSIKKLTNEVENKVLPESIENKMKEAVLSPKLFDKAEEIIYSIKCMYVDTKKALHEEMFLSGKVNVIRQFLGVNKFLARKKSMKALEKKPKINYILYTTCNVAIKEGFNKHSGFKMVYPKNKTKLLLLNTTNEVENLFQIHVDPDLVEIPELKNDLKKDFVKFSENYYYYAAQKKMKHFKSLTNELICNKFNTDDGIFDEMLKYVVSWRNRELGGTYKLTKNHIIFKIVEILIRPFIFCPNTKELLYLEEYPQILDKILSSPDIILSDNSSEFLTNILKIINGIICSYFNFKVLETVVKLNYEDLMDKNLKACIHEYGSQIAGKSLLQINIFYLHILMWKAGITSLILIVDNSVNQLLVYELVQFLKETNNLRKFVVITPSSCESLTAHKNLNIFSCLKDLKKFDWHLFKQIIKIDFDTRLPFKLLSNASDMHFVDNFSVNELLNIMNKHYYSLSADVPECLAEEGLKILVNKRIMLRIQNEGTPPLDFERKCCLASTGAQNPCGLCILKNCHQF